MGRYNSQDIDSLVQSSLSHLSHLITFGSHEIMQEAKATLITCVWDEQQSV